MSKNLTKPEMPPIPPVFIDDTGYVEALVAQVGTIAAPIIAYQASLPIHAILATSTVSLLAYWSTDLAIATPFIGTAGFAIAAGRIAELRPDNSLDAEQFNLPLYAACISAVGLWSCITSNKPMHTRCAAAASFAGAALAIAAQLYPYK